MEAHIEGEKVALIICIYGIILLVEISPSEWYLLSHFQVRGLGNMILARQQVCDGDGNVIQAGPCTDIIPVYVYISDTGPSGLYA